MRVGDCQPSDEQIFGGRSRASDVLAGQREISKTQAKALAAYFKFSADLFIRAWSLVYCVLNQIQGEERSTLGDDSSLGYLNVAGSD